MAYLYGTSGKTLAEYRDSYDEAFAFIPPEEQPRRLSRYALAERIAELAYMEAELEGHLGPHADRYLARLVREAVRRNLARDLPVEVYERW